MNPDPSLLIKYLATPLEEMEPQATKKERKKMKTKTEYMGKEFFFFDYVIYRRLLMFCLLIPKYKEKIFI